MGNLPVETFTLVRHGFSEANFLQKQHKKNREAFEAGVGGVNLALQGVPAEFFNRHDSNMRLTKEGTVQAQITGEWLKKNHPQFDKFYTSPHNRTLETAHHLGLNGNWQLDDRFRERDWGALSSITPEGLDPLTDEMREAKSKSEWYWRPPEGETLASDVRLRMADVLETLYRKGERNRNILAVSHGEFLRVAQFVIERMNPLDWEAMNDDPAYAVANCMVLQYSTRSPKGVVEDGYRWRRAVCPWNESKSWDGGEWVRFESHRVSDAGLIDLYTSHETIFPSTTSLTLGL